MSNITLGLDIGPNSIGWALIDDSILASGVRIFPEGVDRDQQGGEKSKSQTRRVARGMRRQLVRRAKRKQVLQQALVGAGLLPSDEEALEGLLGTNPYELRRRALDEKLDPHEIGRVFLHLNQRRGFLSNRKTDKAKASEAKGMLAEIGELAEAIRNSDSRTLGEYLAKLDGDFDHAASTDKQKTRSRHTRRDMYEQEFDAIWTAQQKHHPKLLTNTLRYGSRGKQTYPKPPDSLGKLDTTISQFGIHGLIFFQRKMYWPKSVVGRCELERSQKRCPRADRAAQRFRLLQEVNNLRLLDRGTGEERELDDDERTKLIEYLWSAKQRTFDQIRKKLGFTEAVRFNFERGERDKLQGNETDAALRAAKVLGKKWDKFDAPVKDRIVRVLHEEDREDLALKQLVDDCGLTSEEAERALAVNLPDSYMNFSRLAIDKLLPHLERGLLLMADDVSNSVLRAAGYLRPDEREVNQRDALPPSPDLPNPIVRQALVEVRKVVNSVIREHGKPDRIHVELARDAKKSFEERREIRFTNAKRRRKREQARDAIEKFNSDIKPTRNTVNRYLLWKEQDEFCIYCGQKIGIAQLFNGDADLDSLANKVVCHRSCNAEKGDQTPREWLEDSDSERYEQMIRVAERLPYNNQRKLQQKNIELNDFVERQLRDTAYISRCVTQYLRCLGARILCPRGQMTAELRHWWGLNTILDIDGRGEKNRADYRHHAVDALVIALTNDKRLHAMAKARGKDMPPPWEGFRAMPSKRYLASTFLIVARPVLRERCTRLPFVGQRRRQKRPPISPLPRNAPGPKVGLKTRRLLFAVSRSRD